MQQKFGTNDNDGTPRIIDALTEQVLAEPALLTLEHIAQRFQGPLVGTGDHTATAAVIKQRIHGFLQHPLLVAHNNVRSAQLNESLQTIVAVNDATVEVVQIRRREPTTIERHQRAQLRWNNRNDLQDHPFRTRARLNEGFDQL